MAGFPTPPMGGPEGDFRGVGWAWPVQPEPPSPEAPEADRPIALARYEDSIRESILVILGTARGERVMRPTFGCGIHDLVFSPLDSGTAALLSLEVRQALLDWEPRIQLLEVQAEAAPDDPGGSKLLIRIGYRVRSTNNVFNLVYPFYLQQAAG